MFVTFCKLHFYNTLSVLLVRYRKEHSCSAWSWHVLISHFVKIQNLHINVGYFLSSLLRQQRILPFYSVSSVSTCVYVVYVCLYIFTLTCMYTRRRKYNVKLDPIVIWETRQQSWYRGWPTRGAAEKSMFDFPEGKRISTSPLFLCTLGYDYTAAWYGYCHTIFNFMKTGKFWSKLLITN
jgi:hypothetical protein